jgi:DNA-binding PadR family transcriptional regulator
MVARRLTPTSYAVLGYLSMTPMSGYDLTAAVRKSIDQFWQISKSQIYKELPLLEADGLVTARHVEQDRYPDKRIYEITGDGKIALDTWLNSSELPSAMSRIPELLKLFFGHRMDPASIRSMLGTSRQAHADSVARLETLIEQLDGVAGARYARAAARYGLLDARMVVTWIDETLETLDIAEDQVVADHTDALDVIRRIPPRPRDLGDPSAP